MGPNAVEHVEPRDGGRLSGVTPSGKNRHHRTRVASAPAKWARADANCPCSMSRTAIARRARLLLPVAPKEPLAEGASAHFIPVGESSGEGALKEIGISRVYSESFPVVDLGGRRVPVSARDKSRKIVSRLTIPKLELFGCRFGLDSCGHSAAR